MINTDRELYVFQELHLQQLILRTPQGGNFVRNSFVLSLQKGLQAWKQAVIVTCPRLNSTLIGTAGQELLRFWGFVLGSHHKSGRTRVMWEINTHNYFVCVCVCLHTLFLRVPKDLIQWSPNIDAVFRMEIHSFP